MILWLLLWLGRSSEAAPPPDPEELPTFRRDGTDVVTRPVFRREST